MGTEEDLVDGRARRQHPQASSPATRCLQRLPVADLVIQPIMHLSELRETDQAQPCHIDQGVGMVAT